MNGDQLANLAYLALLLTAVGSWVLVEYRNRWGEAARVALAWGLIFLGVAAGYGLWHDLRSDIRPEQTSSDNSVEIPRAEDGHYYLHLTINGHAMQFMADTGATNIVLAPNDAQALGIDMAKLTYLGQADTANGVVRTARVRLDTVTLGPFKDSDIPAYVNQAAMQGSLLGMDYLGQFSIQIAGDKMVLSR